MNSNRKYFIWSTMFLMFLVKWGPVKWFAPISTAAGDTIASRKNKWPSVHYPYTALYCILIHVYCHMKYNCPRLRQHEFPNIMCIWKSCLHITILTYVSKIKNPCKMVYCEQTNSISLIIIVMSSVLWRRQSTLITNSFDNIFGSISSLCWYKLYPFWKKKLWPRHIWTVFY